MIRKADYFSLQLDEDAVQDYDEEEPYVGPERYCSRFEFELSYRDRDPPAVYMNTIFCEICGNYYDESDSNEYTDAIRCACYNV